MEGEEGWAASRALCFECPVQAAAAMTDCTALDYLAELLHEVRALQGWCVLPLLTAADGSCLVNALALAIWGDERPAGALRAALAEELKRESAFYLEQLELAHPGSAQSEYNEACARAKSDDSFLSNVHMVALANVLRRPIILVASQRHMEESGAGYHGVAGTFLPVRWLRQEEKRARGCAPALLGTARPAVLSWSSAARNHFVPLVPLAAAPNEGAPLRPPCGFPVPTPTQTDATVGHVDPFCPPYVPQCWMDALCRSCAAEYSGCWDVPYRRAGAICVPHTLGVGLQPAVRALSVMRHCAEVAEYVTAVSTLEQMSSNLLHTEASDPNAAKYRRVNLANQALQRRVGRVPGGVEVLLALGYSYVKGESVLDGWTVREGDAMLELLAENEDAAVVSAVSGLLSSITKSAQAQHARA